MKKLLFENLSLKISAVLLSVFLWLFVTSRGQSEISLDVPLEFKNIPIGLGIVNAGAKTTTITIKGQERLMKNVKPSNIRVLVDLGKAKKGEGVFYISKSDVQLPYAMSVMNITPSSLKIRIDETVTKSVPVVPAITGVPEKGFFVKSVEVTPQSVKIYGLRSEVRRINELRTEGMDITGLNEAMVQELNIDTAGFNVKPEAGMVKVKVNIGGGKR
ncbi:MAG: hypothetical protein HZA17_02415 [Nitrospirae bacterium]|nr:hypothetical protein [Nitrospirota bacterium]